MACPLQTCFTVILKSASNKFKCLDLDQISLADDLTLPQHLFKMLNISVRYDKRQEKKIQNNSFQELYFLSGRCNKLNHLMDGWTDESWLKNARATFCAQSGVPIVTLLQGSYCHTVSAFSVWFPSSSLCVRGSYSLFGSAVNCFCQLR